MKILKLDKTGNPFSWLTIREAAEYYVHDKVLWTPEVNNQVVMFGGINNNGVRSKLEIAPIIAVKGRVIPLSCRTTIVNSILFARDNNTCQYCNVVGGKLTRDHIIPRGYGGKDIWTNVVTSCFRCNTLKGCRTPEEAGLTLNVKPYAPNSFEHMYFKNFKKATQEQVEYLSRGFKHKELT